MWCVPVLNKEYIKRMENLLDLYEQPYNAREPVFCLDERPVQLLGDVRPSTPAKPGRVAKQDYEYKRNGVVNVFCGVEPLAGRHLIKPTPNRKGPEFAKVIRDISRKYPKAKTIHLVLDNLSTHTVKSLTDYFGPGLGRKLWKSFVVHYTPTHGSWLNQAEIEISLLSRQCFGGNRISSYPELCERTAAWRRDANRRRVKIHWGFTTKEARKKFGYRRSKNRRSQD